jgi:hypothetical protein
VAEKFSDEAVFRAMGGFFFLRLICPALLAPQLHGLLDEPPHRVPPPPLATVSSVVRLSLLFLTGRTCWRCVGEQMAQRQLILVTKVLQNLANDTLPGAKEVRSALTSKTARIASEY